MAEVRICKDCYGIKDQDESSDAATFYGGNDCICVNIEPIEVKKKDSDYCGAV